MATNFNIKTIDSTGAVIRLLANDKLIDCRWPKDWPDTDRMPWLKQTANECLVNMGLSEHIDNDPDTLPDSDPEALVVPEETQVGWWDRVKGWFS